MMRAEVAEAQGRMVEAADLWQGALEKSGGRSTRAARGLARVLCAHGDPDGALRILHSALPPAGLEEVTDGQFLEDLARHYSRLGAQERALGALWVAVERDPERAGTPILLAELLLELGQVELALGPLVRSADARPSHRPTRIALARVRADLYQWTQALEEYQAAANLAPLLIAETLGATRCVLALPADGSRVRWAIRVKDWLELHSPAAAQQGATLRARGEWCPARRSGWAAGAPPERAAGPGPGAAPGAARPRGAGGGGGGTAATAAGSGSRPAGALSSVGSTASVASSSASVSSVPPGISRSSNSVMLLQIGRASCRERV